MKEIFVVRTLFGLEDVLYNELVSFGLQDVKKVNRACTFEGSMKDAAIVNLRSRLAIKVLLPVFQFEAFNENELYRQISEFEWEEWIDLNQTFAIDSSVKSTFFNHSNYVSLKAKDAIVDRIRKVRGARPNVDPHNPHIAISIGVHEQKFYVSLDTTGDPLFKRGYRAQTGPAPINEVLAAGLIDLSAWDIKTPFYDGMCGSGTLLTEAAFKASGKAPNVFRSNFCFMHWPNFDPEAFETLRKEVAGIDQTKDFVIYGSDISSTMVRIAQQNIDNSGFANQIRLKRSSFEKLIPESGNPGTLILNPPYGERMLKADLNKLYQDIGSSLKHHFNGFTACIISSDIEAMNQIGLRPSKRLEVFNGSLACKFHQYKLYEGSKKIHKQHDEA